MCQIIASCFLEHDSEFRAPKEPSQSPDLSPSTASWRCGRRRHSHHGSAAGPKPQECFQLLDESLQAVLKAQGASTQYYSSDTVALYKDNL